MRCRAWARARRGDEGFTILELIIALSLIAIVMAALAPSFWGSLQAAATANHRTTANGLAVKATEAMRAAPYYEVGYSSAAANPSFCTGTDPVIDVTTSALPAGGNETDTVNNIAYTVDSCVYWVSASNGDVEAYKASTVTVTWTDTAGLHTITQNSAIYPGGQTPYVSGENEYAPPTTVASGVLSPPSNVVATPDAAPGVIDVTWTASASNPPSYIVEYSVVDPPSAQPNFGASPPVVGTAWSATGLTPGVEYFFQVVSRASDGSVSNPSSSAGATAPGATAPSCQVNSISLNPSPATVYTGNNPHKTQGTLTNSSSGVAITVNANTWCNSISVQYGLSGSSSTTTVPLTGNNGVFTGTAGSGCTVWSVGKSYLFTLIVDGVPQSSPQATLQVQGDVNGSTHC